MIDSKECVLVVAFDKDGCIGKDGGLPWHIPADLKHFRAVTMGHPIVMGRHTFESIGRALPGRQNIVVTSRGIGDVDGVETAPDLPQAVAKASSSPVMIVGGSQLYAAALPYADRLVVTHVDIKARGDTYFPDVDWSLYSATTEETMVDKGILLRFVEYVRNG